MFTRALATLLALAPLTFAAEKAVVLPKGVEKVEAASSRPRLSRGKW